MTRSIAAAFALLLLGACSSPSPRPTTAGTFEAQSRDDGIKLFIYREKLAIPKAKPIHYTADPIAEAAKLAKFHPAEQIKRAEFNLKRDARLQAFCPNGYTPIEKYAVLDEIVIRGECIYQERLNTAGK